MSQLDKCPSPLVTGAAEVATFLQYSGLHDKTKAEIYAGDILQIDDVAGRDITPGKYKVVFTRGYFGITDNDFEYEPLFVYAGISTVVGNLYENPELLKELDL